MQNKTPIFISAVAEIGIATTIGSHSICPNDNLSDLQVSNLQALTQDEEGVVKFKCVGTCTHICAQGDGFIIHGHLKLSES